MFMFHRHHVYVSSSSSLGNMVISVVRHRIDDAPDGPRSARGDGLVSGRGQEGLADFGENLCEREGGQCLGILILGQVVPRWKRDGSRAAWERWGARDEEI